MADTESGRRHGSADTAADFISALPEDLLLRVLERLGCARAAARTSLLSRRWRGLWTRLPKATLTLHDVPFRSLEAALARAARPRVGHYHLDILVPHQAGTLPGARISSLLRAAAALSPVEMLFALSPDLEVSRAEVGVNLPVHMLNLLRGLRQQEVHLPRFSRATSIDLRARHLRLVHGSSSSCWFPSLERLSLTGCYINLATLIPRCPRLRVLRVNNNGLVDMDIITIHAETLQELYVESSNTWTTCIDVKAPTLKQLTVSFHARGDLRVSILPSMVEKVSWRCFYTKTIYNLGLWGLLEVGFNTTDTMKGLQLPGVHVLSLHMAAQASYRYLNTEHTFAAEIDKHMVTEFSGLDLHLTTAGHSFEAFVLRLIGMHRIRGAIRNLRIVLLRSEVKEACPVKCLCDKWHKPKGWRTQTISLDDLETVEIEGVDGEDHEFDFLKVIFRCAPVLKRVILRLADGVTPSVDWCTEVNNIFKEYPFVKCIVDLGQYIAGSSQTSALT